MLRSRHRRCHHCFQSWAPLFVKHTNNPITAEIRPYTASFSAFSSPLFSCSLRLVLCVVTYFVTNLRFPTMTYVGLFACYAGMLASVVIPNCSLALSLCSTTEVSQDSRLGSTLFVSVQQTPPTADDKTDGEP